MSDGLSEARKVKTKERAEEASLGGKLWKAEGTKTRQGRVVREKRMLTVYIPWE